MICKARSCDMNYWFLTQTEPIISFQLIINLAAIYCSSTLWPITSKCNESWYGGNNQCANLQQDESQKCDIRYEFSHQFKKWHEVSKPHEFGLRCLTCHLEYFVFRMNRHIKFQYFISNLLGHIRCFVKKPSPHAGSLAYYGQICFRNKLKI